YAYSIGRLFAPLLALGLTFFWTRRRWPGVVATWCLYAVFVIPIVAFSSQHPGSLTGRFSLITYLNPQLGLVETVWTFTTHYLRNLNPWWLLVSGDRNPDQIVHVFGMPHFLAVTFAFAVAGMALVWRRAKSEAWSRFLL